MGCASSKNVDAAAPYRPAPTSFAVFDINAIEEPWLKHLNNNNNNNQEDNPKQQQHLTHVPAPILHKLNTMLDSTDAPQSWDEVSKTLQHLNPTQNPPPQPPSTTSPPHTPPQQPQPPRKTTSFHTLEELDAKLKPKPKPEPELSKAATTSWIDNKEKEEQGSGIISTKAVKENPFVVRDRMERQKEERESRFEMMRRDPLSQFPEKCPPGGSETVVLYTTSLGGVRKTFEECNMAREVLEGHRVVFDERDVSLHGDFLRELKDLLAPEEHVVKLPRVFVTGRYVGGLQQLLELNETGRLGRILRSTRLHRGVGRQACSGCGGARFVPCLDCGGSCKVKGASHDDNDRCPHCNENGLVHCPACLSL